MRDRVVFKFPSVQRLRPPNTEHFETAKLPPRRNDAILNAMSVEELYAEARHLPHDKQGELIGRLLQDFGAPDYDVSDAEVARRVHEVDSGMVSDISHEELLAGLEFLQKP